MTDYRAELSTTFSGGDESDTGDTLVTVYYTDDNVSLIATFQVLDDGGSTKFLVPLATVRSGTLEAIVIEPALKKKVRQIAVNKLESTYDNWY